MNIRIAALAICVLMISLGVPHAGLWNFGTEAVYAGTVADSIICNEQNSGKAGCFTDAGNYDIMICWPSGGGYTWANSLVPDETNIYGLETCNSKCSSSYGSSCLTPGSTQASAATVTTFSVDRTTVTSGSPVNIIWKVSNASSSVVILQARTRSGATRDIQTGEQGQTTDYPTETTDYLIVVDGVTLKAVSVTVGGSSGTGTSAGYCCVIQNGNIFTYESQGQATCENMGGRYYTYPCTSPNVQGSYCTQFCNTKGLASGQCTAGYADGVNRFDHVCASNNVCQCGTTGTQQQLASLGCNDACIRKTGPYGGYGYSYYSAYASPVYSTSSMSLPVGVCTDNPQALIISAQVVTGTGTSAAQGLRMPFPADSTTTNNKGLHGCQPTEECWCVYYNFNTASTTASAQTLSSSIPGTGSTAQWTPPDAIQDPPQKQPNERDCNLAVNATLTASFGSVQLNGSGTVSTLSAQKLTQAGEPVTIVGSVTKMTDNCAGYNYTCMTMQQLTCDIESKVLWTTLSYKDCPSGTEQVHAEGEGKSGNWKLIGSVVAMVAASIATGGVGGVGIGSAIFKAAAFSAATATVEGMRCSSSGAAEFSGQVNTGLQLLLMKYGNEPAKKAAITGYSEAIHAAYNDAYEKALLEGVKQSTAEELGKEAAAKVAENQASGVAQKVGANVDTMTMLGVGIAVNMALDQLPVCPSAEEISECFSVCGKKYETKTSYAPTCAGAVMGYKESTYKCGLGECGGFGAKRVNIKILGPQGETAIEDSVTTGADGTFSYTFNAPVGDGEFAAVVSVAKD